MGEEPLWAAHKARNEQGRNIDIDVIAAREQEKPEVTRIAMELAEKDIVTLPDGRRCTLKKKMVHELSNNERYVQEFWGGPKQLGLIRAQENTHWGRLWSVTLGYPNHMPTLDDVRQIRTVFFGEDVQVAWIVPTVAIVDADPALRHLVALMELPRSLSTQPIHLL